MRKFLFAIVFCLYSGPGISQIKAEGMVHFSSDDFFNVIVDCHAYYKIYEDRILVRFEEGSLRKNPKYEQDQTLSRILVSLTSYKDSGSWNPIFDSQAISLDNYTLTEQNPLDISNIPEVQLYEFIIPIEVDFPFEKVGLTITIVGINEHTRYAHAPFPKLD